MPKVTDEYRAQRRQQILDAACACFSRKGFHKATMQDICQEAQLSPGAVYNYFSGKDEIVETLAQASREQNRAMLEGIDASTELASQLEAVVSTLCRALGEADEGPRVDVSMWAAALDNDGLMDLTRQAFDSLIQTLSERLQQQQAQGDVRPELDPRAIARVVLALVLGMEIQKVVDEDLDVEQYVRASRALLRGTLGTPDPQSDT